jgi:hypothetical protein
MIAAAASRALASESALQQWDAPFLAVQTVLAEIGPTAARSDAHSKAALRVIEN